MQGKFIDFTLHSLFSADTLLLNYKILSNARTTSPDGCSKCGYTFSFKTKDMAKMRLLAIWIDQR